MEEPIYRCLVCDKNLKFDGDFLHDAGYMIVSFHYGSRHDQCMFNGHMCKDQGSRPESKLLVCDKIEAYICDNCFERKFSSMNGFDIVKSCKENLQVQAQESP